jgi:hypothetical protein
VNNLESLARAPHLMFRSRPRLTPVKRAKTRIESVLLTWRGLSRLMRWCWFEMHAEWFRAVPKEWYDVPVRVSCSFFSWVNAVPMVFCVHFLGSKRGLGTENIDSFSRFNVNKISCLNEFIMDPTIYELFIIPMRRIGEFRYLLTFERNIMFSPPTLIMTSLSCCCLYLRRWQELKGS